MTIRSLKSLIIAITLNEALAGMSQEQRRKAIRAMVERVDRVKIETLLEEAYRVHDAPLNEAAATQRGRRISPEIYRSRLWMSARRRFNRREVISTEIATR